MADTASASCEKLVFWIKSMILESSLMRVSPSPLCVSMLPKTSIKSFQLRQSCCSRKLATFCRIVSSVSGTGGEEDEEEDDEEDEEREGQREKAVLETA